MIQFFLIVLSSYIAWILILDPLNLTPLQVSSRHKTLHCQVNEPCPLLFDQGSQPGMARFYAFAHHETIYASDKLTIVFIPKDMEKEQTLPEQVRWHGGVLSLWIERERFLGGWGRKDEGSEGCQGLQSSSTTSSPYSSSSLSSSLAEAPPSWADFSSSIFWVKKALTSSWICEMFARRSARYCDFCWVVVDSAGVDDRADEKVFVAVGEV